MVVDERYRPVAEGRAGNGYDADLHEFALTPRGTALLCIYAPVPVDLSRVGGAREGIAIEAVVQEVDVATGLVVFEWHSLDHVRPDESYYEVPKRANAPWDYFHINSIAEDRDGDLLVSARHTFAVYKLSRTTGEVRWRLGGKRSDFRMGPGARFAWQHDARRGRDGTLTLFDNAHTRAAPASSQRVTERPGRERSRALALALDERAGTARVARAVTHPRGLLSDTQASTALLPNGNLFVGWGSERWFSEFDARGRMVLDGRLASGNDSYRAYRVRWRGRPAQPPRVVADGSGAAYASWNGATGVARWQLLAGERAGALRPVRTVPRAGFETRIPVPGAARLIAVRALDGRGRPLGTSAPVRRD